jgi:6-phospho-3-hexuloisomerase
VKHTIQADLDEITRVLAGVQPEQAESFINALKAQAAIFLFGKGRSGMVMAMFAMRLMHLGLNVHLIGESTTPAMRAGDLLVIGSGSGETDGCLMAAKKARSLGAAVALLTAIPNSSIASLSNMQVVLPCHSKAQTPKSGSSMLAGTLFEQSLLVFCDCVCSTLAVELGRDPARIMDLHANIE